MDEFQRICRDFSLAYLAGTLVMIMVAMATGEIATTLTIASPLVPMLPAVCVAGLRHGDRTGVRPGVVLSWRFSVAGTLIALVIAVLFLAAAMLIVGGPPGGGDWPVLFNPVVIATITAVLVAIHLLGLRYLFELAAAFGVRRGGRAA